MKLADFQRSAPSRRAYSWSGHPSALLWTWLTPQFQKQEALCSRMHRFVWMVGSSPLPSAPPSSPLPTGTNSSLHLPSSSPSSSSPLPHRKTLGNAWNSHVDPLCCPSLLQETQTLLWLLHLVPLCYVTTFFTVVLQTWVYHLVLLLLHSRPLPLRVTKEQVGEELKQCCYKIKCPHKSTQTWLTAHGNVEFRLFYQSVVLGLLLTTVKGHFGCRVILSQESYAAELLGWKACCCSAGRGYTWLKNIYTHDPLSCFCFLCVFEFQVLDES